MEATSYCRADRADTRVLTRRPDCMSGRASGAVSPSSLKRGWTPREKSWVRLKRGERSSASFPERRPGARALPEGTLRKAVPGEEGHELRQGVRRQIDPVGAGRKDLLRSRQDGQAGLFRPETAFPLLPVPVAPRVPGLYGLAVGRVSGPVRGESLGGKPVPGSGRRRGSAAYPALGVQSHEFGAAARQQLRGFKDIPRQSGGVGQGAWKFLAGSPFGPRQSLIGILRQEGGFNADVIQGSVQTGLVLLGSTRSDSQRRKASGRRGST